MYSIDQGSPQSVGLMPSWARPGGKAAGATVDSCDPIGLLSDWIALSQTAYRILLERNASDSDADYA